MDINLKDLSKFDDFVDISKVNEIHINTYIKKEDFIKMLNNLNFVAVKSSNIDFITINRKARKSNR